jgi:hypothetical protein
MTRLPSAASQPWESEDADADTSTEVTGEAADMARQVRSDKTVGAVEKDLGLSTGAIRNKDGRDTRSDKKLGTIRKEQGK